MAENEDQRNKPPAHDCGSTTCLYHSGHETMMREHGRRLSDQHNDRGVMWTAIKDKVPIRYFVLLVVFVVGGLGFQLMIYDSIKDVQKNVAVIEVTVNQIQKGRD